MFNSAFMKLLMFLFFLVQGIGYKGIAFGFFEDNVEAVYTTDCACCVTPRVVEYIRAVSIAGIVR